MKDRLDGHPFLLDLCRVTAYVHEAIGIISIVGHFIRSCSVEGTILLTNGNYTSSILLRWYEHLQYCAIDYISVAGVTHIIMAAHFLAVYFNEGIHSLAFSI